MNRSRLLATLIIALSIVGCDSGVVPTSTVESNDAPSTPADTSQSSEAESPVRDIESRIVAKDGFFRFVVCRAERSRSGAIIRRDMLAEGDVCRLLKAKFTHCVSDFSKRHKLSGLGAGDLANQDSDIFEKLAKKMSRESETSADFGDACAAYLIATIRHDEILSAIDPLLRKIGEHLNLATDDQRELSARVVSTYSVGWAGNDSEFVFQGWTDPENASSNDSHK